MGGLLPVTHWYKSLANRVNMSLNISSTNKPWEDNEEVKIFQEYLRIPSVQPDVNYDECIKFLQRQAGSLDLPMEIIEVHPGKPVVIISWIGKVPDEPSILLNSHMDVVPVYPDMWTYPPFSAHIDEEGRIYGRGTQDMKSVGIQYLAAIRAMKKEKLRLKRTVHVVFVPDEETGGILGMNLFVQTARFKELNCGFAVDEGLASEEETFKLYYGERTIRRAFFHISGTSGHGSLLLKDTVGEKMQKLMDKIMQYRRTQVDQLESNPNFTIGDVTTVNLTMLSGGIQNNVIPPEITVCFDIRVAIDVKIDEFDKLLKKWCEESGGGIRIEQEGRDSHIEVTKLDDSNKYWVAFKTALDGMRLKVRPQIKAGGTDVRYLRALGIPAIGFSPINNTPVLAHGHDEYLQADVFLKGIAILKNIITAIANV